MNISVTRILQRRILVANNELNLLWKKTHVTLLNAPSRDLPGASKENQEESRSGYHWPRFELSTTRIQVKSLLLQPAWSVIRNT
jgi:hypothetical protein